MAPGPQGQVNYTPLWSNAQSAINFSQAQSLFDFSGAPYVVRGDGCKFDNFGDYDSSSPGQNCCNTGNCANGLVALDMSAVWVDQASGYIAWHIMGPGQFNDTLSYCTGVPQNASYVIEFNSDNNVSTGCDMSSEGCYPGADYQIWYFPDNHTSLFAYYNGSQATADGNQAAGIGNCSNNPGETCYLADSTVHITCICDIRGHDVYQLFRELSICRKSGRE